MPRIAQYFSGVPLQPKVVPNYRCVRYDMEVEAELVTFVSCR